jgi:ectoine hydroxylase-related dioxygenase (phytanoyl-CoA dioxygenase family)
MTTGRSTVPTTADFALTDAERALLPGPDDIAFYREHGWYLTGRIFDDAELDALQAATETYYGGRRDRELPVRPPHLAAWEPSHGPVQRHNDYVHYQSHAIGRILRKPLLGAVAAALAGTEEIRVFQATLILKPPNPAEPTNLVPWHMDRHYWQTCTSERMLTAFVPFHDCDEQMGTITMIDGSHRWKEVAGDDSTRHFARRDPAQLQQILDETARFNGDTVRPVPMVIPRGHLSFHHCRLYHGSGPNQSDRPRRAVSLHLQDGENRYRRYLRPDGSQVVYNHDVLVRTVPGAGPGAPPQPDYADPEFCPTVWRAPR